MIGFDSPYYGRIVSAKEFLDLIRAEIAGLDCHDKSGQVLGGKRTTAYLRKAPTDLDPEHGFAGPPLEWLRQAVWHGRSNLPEKGLSS